MGADEHHITPSLLPTDHPRGRAPSSARAHVACMLRNVGASDDSGAPDPIPETIAILIALIARWTRDDMVTIDLTGRARAASGLQDEAARVRISVDAAGEPDLQALTERLQQTMRHAPTVTDAAVIVIDVGDAPSSGEPCELLVRLWITGGAVNASADFDAALFDQATIERFTRCASRMAAHVELDAGAGLARIPLLDAFEQQQIVHGFNDTAVPRHGMQVMHRMVEAQVQRTPDAIAAGIGGRTMRYSILNAHANALAVQLIAQGVGPHRVIGVCFERSLELLVTLLAIHKAGGAFLPLDPDLPRDRLRYMLGDSHCTLVLTHGARESLVNNVIDAAVVTCITVPELSEAHAPDDLNDRDARSQPEHLAYVLYTSGSTGQPKGVLVPHRALCNHASWFASQLGMTSQDRVLQQASISFDAAMPELFAPLVVGACVVFAQPGAHRDILAFPDLVRHERITIAQLVPSALRVAAASPAFAGPTTLRYLVSGGEALDAALAADVRRRLPTVRLGNFYGPTEATVDAAAYEIVGDPVPDAVLPIGTPIANSRCRILDPFDALVPVGVPGELHVGGLCLSHGYQQQPERTAASFIDDPFLSGEKLYRTGDLARYRADGNIEYLGRVDTQVKLRGYRIELAEVEAPLLSHPQIQQAAVVLREDVPGDAQLVAYVVAEPGVSLSDAELRTVMRSRLPAYMVPSAFCFTDALPLTSNGKIDRRALPVPTVVTPGARDVSTPDDAIELALQRIWERVLGTAPVGVDDDFFSLGGHSLKAIRVLSEIERELGRTLRAAALFEAPTIRMLAARLRDEKPPEPTTIVSVRRVGSRTPLFFAPGGGGELFVFDALARALGTEQPLYVLDMYVFDEIRLDVATITLAAVAARMIADLRGIQPAGPYQLAGYSLGGNLVLEIAQQLRASGNDVHIVALLDCDGPGYPLVQPFVTRLGRHVRHAFALGVPDGVRYLMRRIGNMSRFVTGPAATELNLYADQEESRMVPAHVIEALERSLGPVLAAWERYVPRFYGGRVLLVRADIRRAMIGVVDVDPLLGWGPVIGGGIRTATMPCDHFAMLHSVNAERLAAILVPELIGTAGQASPERAELAPMTLIG